MCIGGELSPNSTIHEEDIMDNNKAEAIAAFNRAVDMATHAVVRDYIPTAADILNRATDRLRRETGIEPDWDIVGGYLRVEPL